MLHFFIGIVTGFIISIPPGPVAATIISTTLRQHRRAGYSAAFGVALADVVLCLLASFASIGVLAAFGTFIASHHILSIALQSVVAIVFIGYGVWQWKQGEKRVSIEPIEDKQIQYEKKPFFLAMITALSNAVNPTFIPSLAALLTLFQSHVPQSYGIVSDKLLFTTGFGVGCYCWLVVVVELVEKYHRGISLDGMQWLFRIMGGIMVGFGVIMILRTIRQMIELNMI